MAGKVVKDAKSFWKTFKTRNARRETNLALKQHTGTPSFDEDETPKIGGEFSEDYSVDLLQQNYPLGTIGDIL